MKRFIISYVEPNNQLQKMKEITAKDWKQALRIFFPETEEICLEDAKHLKFDCYINTVEEFNDRNCLLAILEESTSGEFVEVGTYNDPVHETVMDLKKEQMENNTFIIAFCQGFSGGLKHTTIYAEGWKNAILIYLENHLEWNKEYLPKMSESYKETKQRLYSLGTMISVLRLREGTGIVGIIG